MKTFAIFFFRKKLSRLEHVRFLKVSFASYFRKRLSKENFLVLTERIQCGRLSRIRQLFGGTLNLSHRTVAYRAHALFAGWRGSVERKSGACALLDDLDPASPVGRSSSRAAEAHRDPLDACRPAVRARPERRPAEGATATTGTDAARRRRRRRRRGADDVVGDRKTAASPAGPGGRRARNVERVALSVAVAIDDRARLTSAHLDRLL